MLVSLHVIGIAGAVLFHARKAGVSPVVNSGEREEDRAQNPRFFAAAAVAASALVSMAPLTASAAPAADAAATLPNCSSDRVVEAVFDMDVYSGWDSFNVVDTIAAGTFHFCITPAVFIGRRYTACGESDGNGWLNVSGDNGIEGWAPQACFVNG